jgi:hypothetical protein
MKVFASASAAIGAPATLAAMDVSRNALSGLVPGSPGTVEGSLVTIYGYDRNVMERYGFSPIEETLGQIGSSYEPYRFDSFNEQLKFDYSADFGE